MREKFTNSTEGFTKSEEFLYLNLVEPKFAKNVVDVKKWYVLPENSSFEIKGDLNLGQGEGLFVGRNSKLLFHPGASLEADYIVLAGELDMPVVLTSSVQEDTAWSGIKPRVSFLANYLDISDAKLGKAAIDLGDRSSAWILNSKISHASTGLYSEGGEIYTSDLDISNIERIGIEIVNSNFNMLGFTKCQKMQTCFLLKNTKSKVAELDIVDSKKVFLLEKDSELSIDKARLNNVEQFVVKYDNSQVDFDFSQLESCKRCGKSILDYSLGEKYEN